MYKTTNGFVVSKNVLHFKWKQQQASNLFLSFLFQNYQHIYITIAVKRICLWKRDRVPKDHNKTAPCCLPAQQ